MDGESVHTESVSTLRCPHSETSSHWDKQSCNWLVSLTSMRSRSWIIWSYGRLAGETRTRAARAFNVFVQNYFALLLVQHNFRLKYLYINV